MFRRKSKHARFFEQTHQNKTKSGHECPNTHFFYNSIPHKLGFDVNFPGVSALPSQGKTIESTGVAGEATRKIQVVTLYRQPPAIFTGALYSDGGISQ